MRNLFFFSSIVAMLCSVAFSQTSRPATTPAGPVIGKCLVIMPVSRFSRQSMLVDPIEAMIVANKFQPPKAGDEINGHKWRAVEGKENTFANDALEGGWAYLPIDSPDDRVMILAAAGQTMTYVNGEPRGGDVYQAGYVRLPIHLRAGRNDLLFPCARGELHVELIQPRANLFVDAADATTPDFVKGVAERQPMAVLVTNATTESVNVDIDGGQMIPPLSVRKIRKTIAYDGRDISKIDTEILGQPFSLRVVDPLDSHKRTFISNIDGSVQYYSIVPQNPAPVENEKPALVLSLHGASVEATSQAGAYSHKSWANIVCPTNRRPFGFDWEDWGRLDALEVLADAEKHLPFDPTRVYLTGHSMGGHGTWQIGSIYPDHFAAIGVSAGWLSFASYRDRPTTNATSAPASAPAGITDLLRRATATTDTQSLMPNLSPLGVYILHGTDDDNVPFTEAQTAVKILGEFHHDFRFFAQPKAGHWWDASEEPGADCVDWAPMYDFFARHRLPQNREVRDVDFRTVNPAVSSRCFWLSVDAQIQPLEMSHVMMRCDPGLLRFVGTTENVARLHVDLRRLPAHDKPATIEIDGAKLPLAASQTEAWLFHDGQTWKQGAAPDATLKSASRSGPFKLAFTNRMVFVYPTHGSQEENIAAMNKARFDAETFWYRGNGSVDVVPDTDAGVWQKDDRNVIVYGNADTNAAWNLLLADSPIQVNRGKVRVGEREFAGDDLAAMFCRPRAGSERAMIAAVASTGPAGMRLTNRMPVFSSGVGMPDWTVFGPQVLQKGLRAAKCAGFFANDWTISPADSVFSGEDHRS